MCVFKQGSVVFKEGVWYLKRCVVFQRGCVVFKVGVWYLKRVCGI